MVHCSTWRPPHCSPRPKFFAATSRVAEAYVPWSCRDARMWIDFSINGDTNQQPKSTITFNVETTWNNHSFSYNCTGQTQVKHSQSTLPGISMCHESWFKQAALDKRRLQIIISNSNHLQESIEDFGNHCQEIPHPWTVMTASDCGLQGHWPCQVQLRKASGAKSHVDLCHHIDRFLAALPRPQGIMMGSQMSPIKWVKCDLGFFAEGNSYRAWVGWKGKPVVHSFSVAHVLPLWIHELSCRPVVCRGLHIMWVSLLPCVSAERLCSIYKVFPRMALPQSRLADCWRSFVVEIYMHVHLYTYIRGLHLCFPEINVFIMIFPYMDNFPFATVPHDAPPRVDSTANVAVSGWPIWTYARMHK